VLFFTISFNLSLTVQPTIFAAQEHIMRKILVLALAFFATLPAFSQEPATKKKLELPNGPGDHFMVQLAYNNWQGAPDSISSHISGFQRSANVYVMLNKPFKSSPKLSLGIGLGIGTSNIYFKKMNVEIGASTPKLPFIATDSTDNYKKYKLTTAYLEIPLELRFTDKPETPNKSLKGAIGIKVGTLVNAHTKAKVLRNEAGNTLNSSAVKTNNKSYFNTTRLAATGRIGYGAFSLFGAYSLTGIFKDGVAEDIKLLQVGITISGL
jgi:hypothetical protein